MRVGPRCVERVCVRPYSASSMFCLLPCPSRPPAFTGCCYFYSGFRYSIPPPPAPRASPPAGRVFRLCRFFFSCLRCALSLLPVPSPSACSRVLPVYLCHSSYRGANISNHVQACLLSLDWVVLRAPGSFLLGSCSLLPAYPQALSCVSVCILCVPLLCPYVLSYPLGDVGEVAFRYQAWRTALNITVTTVIAGQVQL